MIGRRSKRGRELLDSTFLSFSNPKLVESNRPNSSRLFDPRPPLFRGEIYRKHGAIKTRDCSVRAKHRFSTVELNYRDPVCVIEAFVHSPICIPKAP